ncbi:DUF2891 domain-containing protein [Patiriisocius marinus]|uniref:DUF2891 domain-containing protein n=1 Tax=Patiriisocius marinus TaxID=1397112 RepID=UPI00124E78BD|nr:DUF2891 domain-containing protein [Patiriisocius marinus]
MKKIVLLFCLLLCISCDEKVINKTNTTSTTEAVVIKQYKAPVFSISEANTLLQLPLHCVETEYPNKLGQTIGSANDMGEPKTLHPIFYGCFDWHSAVHGYWSMVTLVSQFPELDEAEAVKSMLKKNITKENVAQEIAYFEKKINNSYERTYGWAWLLKLSQALHEWDDPMAAQLEANLKPLTTLISKKYIEFLPKLVYPIRVGEHTNTGFGLSFAYDYAVALNDENLKKAIVTRARDFFLKDKNCPIQWEPSGYDFLSPCLEEIDIMRRVLSKEEFAKWISHFMPELTSANYQLEVGKVGDRSDGKLVHLDGLNFSRAWVFYGLANQFSEYKHLKNIANQHVAYSYPNLLGDSYEGGHWLGSFAIYALTQY